MAKVKVSVTVPDASSFRAASDGLVRAGLAVDASLDILGIVTGEVEEADVARLGEVPGVGAVERQGTVSAPAPVARQP